MRHALILLVVMIAPKAHGEQVTDWMRLIVKDSTTIIPHVWYMGESSQTIEQLIGGKWRPIKSAKKGEVISLCRFSDASAVLGITDQLGAPGQNLLFEIYRRDASVPARVPQFGPNFQALPVPNKRELTLVGPNEDGWSITHFSEKGVLLDSRILPFTSAPSPIDRSSDFIGYLQDDPVLWTGESLNVFRQQKIEKLFIAEVKPSAIRAPHCVDGGALRWPVARMRDNHPQMANLIEVW